MAVALLCISVSASAGAACGGGGSSSTPTATDTPSSTASAAPTQPPPTLTPSPAPAFLEPPNRDLIDLAARFRGLDPGTERLARTQPYDYVVGDTEEFYVLDLSGEPSIQTTTATLRKITDHAYFFIEAGFSFGEATLDQLGSDFETLVYPTVRSAFGSEWTPGVDSDERITLLHANLSGAGGYFSGSDEFPRTVVLYSNEREMLYLEADFLYSPGIAYNSLVAHEFQHLVHWYADGGEDSWVNEGMAQVAAELVGGGSDWLSLFLASPDTGLIDWPEIGSSAVHYAASELFLSYLLDRYGGPENSQALLTEQGDSIDGVRAYLDPFGAKFEDVFADWLIANYLDEGSGKYAHPNVATSIDPTTTAGPGDAGDDDVSQFAADYIEVDLPSGGTFSFDGADEVTIGVPETDGAFYWSQRGDDIDSRMTREFDLTGVTTATLRFDTWFDIEEGWDFAYVAVSKDGGATWEALEGTGSTDYDPVDQSYGPAYTGESGGWIAEAVDLSDYAGSDVLVRFEYVTDESTHHTGFAIDNISVPEIGFADDGDSADEWDAEGFVRVDGPLPQRWIVQAIDLDSHDVVRLDLDHDNTGSALLGARSVIVVSPVTEGTSERASYGWSASE